MALIDRIHAANEARRTPYDEDMTGPCLYCRQERGVRRKGGQYICPDCLDAMREDHDERRRDE